MYKSMKTNVPLPRSENFHYVAPKNAILPLKSAKSHSSGTTIHISGIFNPDLNKNQQKHREKGKLKVQQMKAPV